MILKEENTTRKRRRSFLTRGLKSWLSTLSRSVQFFSTGGSSLPLNGVLVIDCLRNAPWRDNECFCWIWDDMRYMKDVVVFFNFPRGSNKSYNIFFFTYYYWSLWFESGGLLIVINSKYITIPYTRDILHIHILLPIVVLFLVYLIPCPE